MTVTWDIVTVSDVRKTLQEENKAKQDKTKRNSLSLSTPLHSHHLTLGRKNDKYSTVAGLRRAVKSRLDWYPILSLHYKNSPNVPKRAIVRTRTLFLIPSIVMDSVATELLLFFSVLLPPLSVVSKKVADA